MPFVYGVYIHRLVLELFKILKPIQTYIFQSTLYPEAWLFSFQHGVNEGSYSFCVSPRPSQSNCALPQSTTQHQIFVSPQAHNTSFLYHRGYPKLALDMPLATPVKIIWIHHSCGVSDCLRNPNLITKILSTIHMTANSHAPE